MRHRVPVLLGLLVSAWLATPLAAQQTAACELAGDPSSDPAFAFPLSRLAGLAGEGCDARALTRAGDRIAAALDLAGRPVTELRDPHDPERVDPALLDATLELLLSGHPEPFDTLIDRLASDDGPEAAAALAVLGQDGAAALTDRAERLAASWPAVALHLDTLPARASALAKAAPERAERAAQGGTVTGQAIAFYGAPDLPDPCTASTELSPEAAAALADALEADARRALSSPRRPRRLTAARGAIAGANLRSGCAFAAPVAPRAFDLDDPEGADRAMALAAALPVGPAWPRDTGLPLAVWLDSRGAAEAAARFLLEGLREHVGDPDTFDRWTARMSSPAIAAAQRLLEGYGLYDAGIDGIAGPGFARGVAALYAAERQGASGGFPEAGLSGRDVAAIRGASWAGPLAGE